MNSEYECDQHGPYHHAAVTVVEFSVELRLYDKL